MTDVFQVIEKKQSLAGNVTLNFGDRTVAGINLVNETAMLLTKVFNKTYIEENIFTPEKRATSIFYLRQESIEKQKKIEQHKNEIARIDQQSSQKIAEKQAKDRELDRYCSDKANNSIKSHLRSNSMGNIYRKVFPYFHANYFLFQK